MVGGWLTYALRASIHALTSATAKTVLRAPIFRPFGPVPLVSMVDKCWSDTPRIAASSALVTNVGIPGSTTRLGSMVLVLRVRFFGCGELTSEKSVARVMLSWSFCFGRGRGGCVKAYNAILTICGVLVNKVDAVAHLCQHTLANRKRCDLCCANG